MSTPWDLATSLCNTILSGKQARKRKFEDVSHLLSPAPEAKHVRTNNSQPSGCTMQTTQRSDTQAIDPQIQCVLFQLPREIRNQIYHLVLAVPMKRLNELGTLRITQFESGRKLPSVLSILRTCRLLRDEAEEVFYFTNHLELQSGFHRGAPPSSTKMWPRRYKSHARAQLASFVTFVNPKRLSAIRDITVYGAHLAAITDVFRHVRCLENLTHLSLYFETLNMLRLWPTAQYMVRDYDRERPNWIEAADQLPAPLQRVVFRIYPAMYVEASFWWRIELVVQQFLAEAAHLQSVLYDARESRGGTALVFAVTSSCPGRWLNVSQS